jgi:hypothetical protein
MAAARLTSDDRGFFAALDRVVYGNPFTENRAELIAQLLPGATGQALPVNREQLAQQVAPRLRAFLEPAALERLNANDRRLVQSGFLYCCYHHHVAPLDKLIEQQAARGTEQQADTIARSVAAELAQCGMHEDLALHYFALFFQLRRAFHFILGSLSGDCESMRKLRRALWDNVFTHDMRAFETGLWRRMEDFSTLILGETGSGKGAAAAAIGRSEFIPYLKRERRFAANFADSFIAINLSQFAESLIESELFGHRKGAFTGAIEQHQGVFERCSAHGSLFLDEIGEAGAPIQIKLLQVLQERSFTPIGSHEKKRFSGRVIAATNRSLDELRSAQRFRDDFYYRLCSDVIVVPTLRQRIEESPRELDDLVRLLLERIGGEPDAQRAASVQQALERDLPRGYSWPGNVRELEQALRRILLTGHYRGDTAGVSSSEEDRFAELARSGQLNAQELLGRYCALLYRSLGSYAAVAERTGLDRRTARKHVVEQMEAG